MSSPDEHAESCAALADYCADCDCGVGIPNLSVSVSTVAMTHVDVAKLLVESQMCPSIRAAERLIKSRAVEVDENGMRRKLSRRDYLYLKEPIIIKVGKKWKKLIITGERDDV